jgi:ACT domain-containing protein
MDSVKERQTKEKASLLEQLKKMPIVHLACERAHISRATYYRWRTEDKPFRKLADEAVADGEALITDMSESQLITLIKEKKFPAIQMWLRHHHPKYKNTLALVDERTDPDVLTPEQQSVVKAALKLAKLSYPTYENINQNT